MSPLPRHRTAPPQFSPPPSAPLLLPPPTQPSRRPAFSFLALLTLLLGCAAPGTPRAPSLHLPDRIPNLYAERLDTQVILTFTTPSATTDGGKPHFPLTAALCRQLAAGPCLQIQRQLVAPGPSRLVDTLPPALLLAPATLLTYRIDLQNRDHHSAGPSDPAFAASGPAPPPIGTLTLTSSPRGALLTWPPAAPAIIEIRRTPNTPKAQTTTLRTPTPQDPGGLVDPTPLDPRLEIQTFTYTAQRTQTLTLSGKTVTLHGLPSPAVAFLYRDIFAPDAPVGLIAIPTASSIDLSWEPRPEPNLLGYNIYRTQPGRPRALLNPKPVPAPAFRDLTATPNTPYTYTVTAISRHNNQSPPSAPITETITP